LCFSLGTSCMRLSSAWVLLEAIRGFIYSTTIRFYNRLVLDINYRANGQGLAATGTSRSARWGGSRLEIDAGPRFASSPETLGEQGPAEEDRGEGRRREGALRQALIDGAPARRRPSSLEAAPSKPRMIYNLRSPHQLPDARPGGNLAATVMLLFLTDGRHGPADTSCLCPPSRFGAARRRGRGAIHRLASLDSPFGNRVTSCVASSEIDRSAGRRDGKPLGASPGFPASTILWS
jgi:hypothetical protein